MADTDTLRGAVAEEVRAMLARRRIRSTELARRMGKSHMYVWRRLNADIAFDIDDLEEVAAVLEVPAGELLPRHTRVTGGYPRVPRQRVRPHDGRPPSRPAMPAAPNGERRTSLKARP